MERQGFGLLHRGGLGGRRQAIARPVIDEVMLDEVRDGCDEGRFWFAGDPNAGTEGCWPLHGETPAGGDSRKSRIRVGGAVQAPQDVDLLRVLI